jgi:hypothetical protein
VGFWPRPFTLLAVSIIKGFKFPYNLVGHINRPFRKRKANVELFVTGGYAKSRQIKQNNMIVNAKADAEASAK